MLVISHVAEEIYWAVKDVARRAGREMMRENWDATRIYLTLPLGAHLCSLSHLKKCPLGVGTSPHASTI
jgi:hypothetical protein